MRSARFSSGRVATEAGGRLGVAAGRLFRCLTKFAGDDLRLLG
jgi:hypothetical protein